MSLRNRVTPVGEIVATSARGSLMGNRGGCFHRADRTLLDRPFVSHRWIACVLEFRGRHREVMASGRYTELFFLDEATALAAGHRPCYECRREQANDFARIWQARTQTTRPPTATEIDATLHTERIDPHSYDKRTHLTDARSLPDLAFVLHQDAPAIVWQGALRKWTAYGYDQTIFPLPQAPVSVLTPATIVAQLAAGYRAGHHESLAAR